MSEVFVSHAVLQWAFQQTDQSRLGDKLLNNINKWLEGTKLPTFAQIKDFSRRSNIPLGYFFLEEPPEEELEIFKFRTIDSIQHENPSRDLIDVATEMEKIQSWMRDYKISQGYDVLSVIGSVKNLHNAAEIAEIIRNDLNLEYDWYSRSKTAADAFKYVRSLAQNIGILVFLNGVVGNNNNRVLNVKEFRAFAIADDWAPLIFINSRDAINGKLFSLFHEIVHLWIGKSDLYNDDGYSLYRGNDETEVICNKVAAELMVPESEFKKLWHSIDEKNVYSKIKKITSEFKCSQCVIARKALDNHYINESIYHQIAGFLDNDKQLKNKHGGGNYYSTMNSRLDKNLVLALCSSLMENKVTYTEAYEMTGTSRKTFHKIARDFGGYDGED